MAVAVRDTGPGDARAAYLDSGNRFGITARDAIPLGHKIALRDLGENENVLEYGVLIGLTRGPGGGRRPGAHPQPEERAVAEKRLTGYRRPDGRVGIRNHVVIVPVDDLSNAVAESVARAIPGTLPLPHPYGRLQFGADLDLFFQTMIGTGANPNVAARRRDRHRAELDRADRRAASRRPASPWRQFSIERHGDLRVVRDGSGDGRPS